MNLILSFFIRAKHWQIFLLSFGMFVIGNVAAQSSSITATTQSQEDFGKVGPLYVAITVLFMLCYLAWWWSMGSFLSKIVQPALRLKVGFFRLALIYPLVYGPLFLVLFHRISINPVLLAVIFPLHFFTVFCIFYVLYFVSKSLVLAETSKLATFYDYAGPFFLIWFFPIGVWFIQPRINRLYLQPVPPPIVVEPAVLERMSTSDAYAGRIPTEAPPVYAGFWLRFAAALIDALAMFIPLLFVTILAYHICKGAIEAKGYDSDLALIAWPVVSIIFTLFYFALLESSPWQATLGKRATGLYVSDIEGRRSTLARATGRTLAKYVSSLTLGVGFIMCGFTKKKQALHDIIASCLVLRRP